MKLIQDTPAISSTSIELIFVPADTTLDQVTITNTGANLIIIDSDISLDFYSIRSFIESNMLECRVIFTTERAIEDD